MKIIELLNKIANGEKVPKMFKYNDKIWRLASNRTYFIGSDYGYDFWVEHGNDKFEDEIITLTDEIEILEEKKKIPEKLDMVLLGQCDNWTQKYNKDTKKMENTHIELNPYVIDTLRENILEIQHKFNEILDYLKSKGE